MTETSVTALQKAIFAALSSDANITALVGQRIYDQPPTEAQLPYISFGVFELVPDVTGCGRDADEVSFQIDGWSSDFGRIEAHKMADAVRGCLDAAPLTLDGYELCGIVFERLRVILEPDGIIKHAITQFTARIQRP